jgi:RNA polymerase sigma-54 factor
LDLSQEISQILQENPMLERMDGADRFENSATGTTNSGTEGATPEAPAEDSTRIEHDDTHSEVYDEMAWGDRAVSAAQGSSDDEEGAGFQQGDAHHDSLQQHLIDQLSLMPLSERDRYLVLLLIEALNEDGYLTIPLEELGEIVATHLAEMNKANGLTRFDLGTAAIPVPEFQTEIDPVELNMALHLLQSLEPTGVGARDLGECLWLQLNTLPADTPNMAAAKELVKAHLPLLAEREYGKLKRLLNLTDTEFIHLRQLITSLNPRPGAHFSPVDTRYVVPDVYVKKIKGLWITSLNADAIPKLRINELYAGILRANRDGGSGLSTQLQEARWLIKNVQQRFETILRVSQAIVDRQRMFFEHGEVAMRPLTLKEIAESVELHESTISRVTTQKYMMTPRGLFEFKYFFGSSLATDAGGLTSSTAIKALIKQYIEAENPLKPLSDNTLADNLGKQGFVVARRTVAKYREMLNIPPANQRKSL